MRKKLILIMNIISPYRIPVFNHLAKDGDRDFMVIFLAGTEGSRHWKIYKEEIKFDYKILKNLHFYIQSKEMPIYFNRGLWGELKKFRPEAICVCGYHYLVTVEALIYAKLTGTKITLWAGSHLLSGFLKNPLTDFYKKMIIPRFDFYITYGAAAKQQIIHYGADPGKIIVGCNTVDIEWFMNKCKEIRNNEISQMRKKYPSKNILYVGEFIERKAVINLIAAFEKLGIDNVGLILVGKGKEKDKYSKYIKGHNVKNVFFEGFVQKEDIVKYYKLTDVFVLPSFNEVWGLVVNEAMACGIPVISSKYAGVTRDLVQDGVNGYSFHPANIDELTQRLRELMLDDEKRIQMGKKSLEIIRNKTPQRYAESILKAVNLV